MQRQYQNAGVECETLRPVDLKTIWGCMKPLLAGKHSFRVVHTNRYYARHKTCTDFLRATLFCAATIDRLSSNSLDELLSFLDFCLAQENPSPSLKACQNLIVRWFWNLCCGLPGTDNHRRIWAHIQSHYSVDLLLRCSAKSENIWNYVMTGNNPVAKARFDSMMKTEEDVGKVTMKLLMVKE